MDPNSDVETFAAVRLEVDSWRWSGVPFLIRAGKCMPVTATEVFVKLRKPPLAKMGADGRNYFRFRLGPDFELSLGARVKRPGPLMAPMPVELSAVKYAASYEMEAYERLLTDAMKGDQLLFVLSSSAAVNEVGDSNAWSCSSLQVELRAARTTSTRICSHHSAPALQSTPRAPGMPL